jgi:uncharacterized protein (TIGR03435 family)
VLSDNSGMPFLTFSNRATACVFAAFTLCGQTTSSSLAFDASSVRRADAPAVGGIEKTVRTKTGRETGGGGPDTADPGRVHYPRVTLKALLMNAYDVRENQIAGPAWLDTEWYSIEATMPPETTKEQFRVMLRNLLQDRFKMASHPENRDLPVFALTVGRNGPKMNGSEPVTIKGPGGVALSEIKPIVHATVVTPPSFTYRWTAHQATMDDLAKDLADEMHGRVTNLTGLKDKYNFTLGFSRRTLAAQPAADLDTGPPDVLAALQSIGLKLEERKGPASVIVIDRIEKVPTEN